MFSALNNIMALCFLNLVSLDPLAQGPFEQGTYPTHLVNLIWVLYKTPMLETLAIANTYLQLPKLFAWQSVVKEKFLSHSELLNQYYFT